MRDILPDAQIGEMPTAIYCSDIDTQSVTAVSYKEICFLGASNDQPSNDESCCLNKNFGWLWRSDISDFERDSFYFRRWIARMFEEEDWLSDVKGLRLDGIDWKRHWSDFSSSLSFAITEPDLSKGLARVKASNVPEGVEKHSLEPYVKKLRILRAALRLDSHF